MRTFLASSLLSLLSALVVLGSGCKETDDLAAIRAVTDDIVANAEKHEISGMMEHATGDFLAFPGAHDEQSARKILFVTFRRYGTFEIAHPRFQIDLADDKKTATVTAPFTIVRQGQSTAEADLETLVEDPAAWADAVGEAIGDPHWFELKLRKDGDVWKVRRADVTTSRGY